MSIARYENVTVNTITSSVDELGQYTTTIVPWFTSRAVVADVRNNLRIADRYRAYQELVNLTFNYTPNIKAIVDNQDEYSLTWRGQEWRITDAIESDDRMRVTFLCFYNQPNTPV